MGHSFPVILLDEDSQWRRHECLPTSQKLAQNQLH